MMTSSSEQILLISMKYTSKFKTPRKATNNELKKPEVIGQSPAQDFVENNPHTDQRDKKEKKSISYFQKDSQWSASIKSGSRRFNKMNSLLDNIMCKHLEMKNKLERLKRQQQNKENASMMEYTFEPKIKPNPRYPIHSRMEERNKSWDQARTQRYTSIRQEKIEDQVKECTFSPKIISKPKSQHYLKEKQLKTHLARDDRDSDEINKLENKFIKMTKRQLNTKFVNEKKKPGIDIESIKGMIKSEISRIPFNF